MHSSFHNLRNMLAKQWNEAIKFKKTNAMESASTKIRFRIFETFDGRGIQKIYVMLWPQTFFVNRSKNRWTQQRTRGSVYRQEIRAKIKTSCIAINWDIRDFVAVRVFYFKRVRETDQMYFNTSLECMRREHKYIFFLSTHTNQWERNWNEVRIISSVVFRRYAPRELFPTLQLSKHVMLRTWVHILSINGHKRQADKPFLCHHVASVSPQIKSFFRRVSPVFL